MATRQKDSNENSQFLQLKNLQKAEKEFVLQGISFSQEQGEKLVIAGETGAGKSTLLKCIAGLLQPDSGEIFFQEERVKGPAEKLVAGHPQIAYLSQHFELPHSLRVAQVVRYASILPEEETARLYKICRIDHLLERRTDQLSGGEKQRIAIARLLSSSPALLLLDEPYSNLDGMHKNTLKAVIEDIGKELNISCTMVSHDPLDSLSWADKILVLQQGKLTQQGTPEQIYRNPKNTYVAGLFGKYTVLPDSLAAELFKHAGLTSPSVTPVFRPEHFTLSASQNSGVAGSIIQVQFSGRYYEVTVELQNTTLLVQTQQPGYVAGQQVSVALAATFQQIV